MLGCLQPNQIFVPMEFLLEVALLLWIGNAHAASLQGSEWKPLRMGEMAVPESSAAFVQFRSKGRLEGHSGCNRLFAEYEAQDGYIFVGPVAATRMACEEDLMAIIVDNETRLVVQGITGSEGSFHAVRNRDYGTNVVAGVTPGKGGQDVSGIPVFNAVAEAVTEAVGTRVQRCRRHD